jgi:hypothetical protein
MRVDGLPGSLCQVALGTCSLLKPLLTGAWSLLGGVMDSCKVVSTLQGNLPCKGSWVAADCYAVQCRQHSGRYGSVCAACVALWHMWSQFDFDFDRGCSSAAWPWKQ